MEQDEYASKWLARNILESLDDRRWQCHSIKNFLRFSKGRGFKEYIYRGVMDTTYSEFFLRKLRQILLDSDHTISDKFMN